MLIVHNDHHSGNHILAIEKVDRQTHKVLQGMIHESKNSAWYNAQKRYLKVKIHGTNAKR